jgi:hypothetical protein
MGPIIFQSLPEIFSLFTIIVLLQVCLLLLLTGRRYLKQVSFIAVGIAGALIGESVSLQVFPAGSWLGIAIGLSCGVLLCQYVRPAGVGVTLAFLAFYGSGYLVSLEYVQYVAALVLFAYGLLLTDLAPSFIANLLASAILLLSGIWLGVPTPAMVSLVSGVATARILVSVLPFVLIGKSGARSGRTRFR